MKKLIQRLTIGPYEWKVYIVDPRNKALLFSSYSVFNSNKEMRETDPDNESPGYAICVEHIQSIFFSTAMNGKCIDATVMHELGHAFLRSYGQTFSDWNEENYCDFLASHMDDHMKIAKATIKAIKQAKKDLNAEEKKKAQLKKEKANSTKK